MPPRTSRQAPIAGRIAAIERHHGPADPRLPALRSRLAGTRLTEDLADWAERAAAELPALLQPEVQAVGRLAAVLDARLTLAGEGPP